MEQAIVDLIKFSFSRTDPMLVACLIAIVYWLRLTNRKIDRHIDQDNPAPHALCNLRAQSFQQVAENIEKYRKENREDHSQLFDLLRDRKDR